MQRGGNESPALCPRAVSPRAAQSKQLWALPSFLPCFTRGCRLEKYVGCCEQIRFMDLDCRGNHSRTENKLPGWSPCLNYAPCWFISCPEYVIECLMDSLFISELTLLSIYIISAEHMFSIERESYFRLFTQRVGRVFSVWTIVKNIELQNKFSSTEGQRKTKRLWKSYGSPRSITNRFKELSIRKCVFPKFTWA